MHDNTDIALRSTCIVCASESWHETHPTFIRRISAKVRFPRPGEGANENPSCFAVSIVGSVVAVNAVLTGVTGADGCRSWQETTANNIPATTAAKQLSRNMANPIPWVTINK